MVGGLKIPRSGDDEHVARCDRGRPLTPTPRPLGPTARSTYGHRHRWAGELDADRAVLRGPWKRAAGRVAGRLAAGQPVLGTATACAARRRVSRDRLRPPRLRAIKPPNGRLRLRHARRRPRSTADPPGPARRHADRVLAWHRGARSLHRCARDRAPEGLRVHREPRTLVRQVRREPQRGRPGDWSPRSSRRSSRTGSSG